MVTFIDTSAIYALLVADDKNHQAATDALARLISARVVLLTTNYILLESAALLQKRIGLCVIQTLHSSLVPTFQVAWISEHEHTRAIEAVLIADRRRLSVVDCVSFLVMRERRVQTAFTFDGHFREQGFTVVPEAA